MPNIRKLPTREDGADGLLRLAETFGQEAVYELILLCRTARNRDQDAGGQAMHQLAVDMVNHEMQASAVDFDRARQIVAARLGYLPPSKGDTFTNFYKILKDERSPDTRARGAYRDRTG